MGLRFLDLFAGIGGFRLGMEQAGHECIGYVEWDKYARKSYEAIHDVEGEWTRHDITEVTDEEWRELRGTVDVICGGFPCQSFSVAGRREGFSDIRGTMFFEIARAAKQIKPQFLLLENVKGLLNHEKGETLRTMLSTLDALGYDAEWCVCNSKDHVPQNRERIFIVGYLRGTSRREIFPLDGANAKTNDIQIIAHREGYRRNTQVFHPDGITETLDTGQGGGRGHHTIVEESESHKVAIPVSTPERANKNQNGRRFKEDGDPMFSLTTMDAHGVVVEDGRPTITIHEATIKGYDIAREGDSINIAMPGSKTRRGRVGKGIANTLETYPNQGVLEGYRIRKITPKEAFRLQGFPDWAFERARNVNSDSQLYKQAGNTVTVPLVRRIAELLGDDKK